MDDIQKKVKHIIACTIFLIIILIVLSFVYLAFNNDNQPVINSLSLIGSYVGAISTLAAAWIASILFNNWRDEKKYDLESNLLTKILTEIQPIYVELLRIRSNSNNLKDIDTKFILKTDYLKNDKLDLFLSTLSIFPNIKTYSTVKNDDTLISLYNKFDKHCYCFIGFYKILFLQKYRDYYNHVLEIDEKLGHQSLISYDIFKPYSKNRRDDLIIDINEILKVFKENALTAQIADTSRQTTYDIWLNETIEHIKEIQKYCIEGLKIPC